METFGKICFTVIALVVSSIVGGYVFMILWKWFVVTTFALPAISLIQAIGIMVLVHYIKFRKPKDKDVPEDWANKLGVMLLEYLFLAGMTLLNGWIVTLFL